MPYPMIKCPTLAELRERLYRDYKCNFKSAKLTDTGPTITFFERDHQGVQLLCPVTEGDDVIIEPHLLRHICDRLQIPKEDFGLVLEGDIPTIIN